MEIPDKLVHPAINWYYKPIRHYGIPNGKYYLEGWYKDDTYQTITTKSLGVKTGLSVNLKYYPNSDRICIHGSYSDVFYVETIEEAINVIDMLIGHIELDRDYLKSLMPDYMFLCRNAYPYSEQNHIVRI